MARPNNNIGVFGDLDLGRENVLHADFRWRGDNGYEAPTNPGTPRSGPDASIRYEVGDLVEYNDRVYIARQQNDNIEPGTNAAMWHDLGDTNVLNMWRSTSSYEAGNLVYRREGGDTDSPALLYVALQDVSAPDQGNNNPAPETDPMAGNPATAVWLRVGGQDVEILSTNRLIGNDGTVARQRYPVVRALSGSTISYTFDEGDLEKLIDELAIPGPTLPNEGDVNTRVLASDDSRLNGLALNFVEFARGSTTGGTGIPFTGVDPRILLRRTGPNSLEITGQGTPTGTGNRDLVVNSIWTLTNPDIIAGNHVSLDVAQDSDGNAVLRISADQQALTAVAPITISDDGDVGLDTDGSLTVTSDELTVNLDGPTLAKGDMGVSVNRRTSSTILEQGTDGLFVEPYTLESDSVTGGASITLSNGDGSGDDHTISLLASTIAAASGNDNTPANISITEDGDNITVNAPPVATWAQSQTGTDDVATIIPLSKLPNLQLGNSHTFESDGTPALNEIRDAVIANSGGQRNGDTFIEWHPGDLLIISGDAPDNQTNGIFVYIGQDQSGVAGGVSPLTIDGQNNGAAPTTATQRGQAFRANFRAVISAETEVQTTLSTFTIDPDSGERTVDALGSLNSVSYSEGQDVIEFLGSGSGGVPLSINQSERISDTTAASASIGGFINNIKIGDTIYRFGPEPPLPRFRMSPTSGSLSLYRSTEQDIDFTASATQTVRAANGDETTETNDFVADTLRYSRTENSDFRGTSVVDVDDGELVIPASLLVDTQIETPGTITFGTTGGDLVGTPTSLPATQLTQIFSGPSGQTGGRTPQNSQAYAAGTFIAWERVSATSYTMTVTGTDAGRLQADIIDAFDEEHAGFYIDGTSSNSIRIPTGGGTFTADQGTEYSDGAEVPALFELGTTNTGAGSGITALDASDDPLPTLTNHALTSFWTTDDGTAGTRTRAGNGTDYAAGTTVSWTTPGNNSLILTIAGTDAARAAADMIAILGGEHDGIFLNEETAQTIFIQNDPVNNAFPGHIDDVPEERVAYRAANIELAGANVQDDDGATVTVTANGTIIDENVMSIMYDTTRNNPVVPPASAVVSFRNNRVAPSTSNPSSSTVSVFTSTEPTTTISNINPQDAQIAAGIRYDIQGWQVQSTAAGLTLQPISQALRYSFPINAGAYGTDLVSSTSNTGQVTRTYTFSYPMMSDPRNRQPNTPPPNTTESITYFRPWGIVAGDIPTATSIPGLPRINDPRAFSRSSVSRDGGAIRLTGSSNDNIYMFVPTGDLAGFDLSRLTLTGAMAGQSFSATFQALTPVTVNTHVPGTTIQYSILLSSASLVGTSLNANLIVI